LGVKVYFVGEAETYTQIDANELLLISEENAEAFCTLGHK
jgi:hypothetical protein